MLVEVPIDDDNTLCGNVASYRKWLTSIQLIQDAPIPSHFNKGKAPQAKYRYKNLKDKNVVLVDDICASRNTLRRNIKMIQKAGGHVVACFVFADSNTKEV